MNTDNMTTAIGGEYLEVLYRDGTTGKVLVRQLPIRALLKDWSSKLGDEAELAEFYCDQGEGWDDLLTIASHEAIIALGEKLNDPTFAAWTERRMAAIKLSKERAEAMTAATARPARILPDSSSTPQPV